MKNITSLKSQAISNDLLENTVGGAAKKQGIKVNTSKFTATDDLARFTATDDLAVKSPKVESFGASWQEW